MVFSLTAIILASFNGPTATPRTENTSPRNQPYFASWPVIWEQGSRKMQHIFQQKGRSNIRCSFRVERMFPWRPVFILSSSQYLMALVLALSTWKLLGNHKIRFFAFLKPQKYFSLCFQYKQSVNRRWSLRESTVIAHKTEAQPAPTRRMFFEIVHITLQTKRQCHLKSSFTSERLILTQILTQPCP